MELGKIVEMPLRAVWDGESTHFTPWLSENLAVLSEKLGLELELEGRETSVGDFSADIVAVDVATNRKVVIENQYGGTDHRHLGQILTYSSGLGASVVVWIAETVRPEHKAAIDFLNFNLKETLQIYAVEARLIRIDNSRPAFSLNLVCLPAEAGTPAAVASEEVSETRERYRVYYQSLIDTLRERHRFTNARVGQPQNWYTFSSENSRMYKYSTTFAQGGRVRVEVYIDTQDRALNKAIFDALHHQRKEVESAYGEQLDWERLDARRACRVAIYRDGDIEADSETLESIKAWVVANLLRMREVFPRFLNRAIEVAHTEVAGVREA